MVRFPERLRADAERIWRAGVEAVAPERLIKEQVFVDGEWLHLGEVAVDLRGLGRIAIVGAGKASGAMAAALEDVLGPRLLNDKHVHGWVNVPADCIRATRSITLHAGRPAGINEPRPEGVEGTRRILDIVGSLESNDLCIALITGGGSALLPAPVDDITLAEKAQMTRLLSAAGANIEQLNIVRRETSAVKGGGLARSCHAGRLVSLVISDVLGDPIDLIASGPTVPRAPDPGAALRVLEEFALADEPALRAIVEYLNRQRKRLENADHRNSPDRPDANHSVCGLPHVSNLILGNNATAVDAAGIEAERLGYSHAMICARGSEGPAEEVGRHLARMAERMRAEDGPDCLIQGGETRVTLVDEAVRGKGSRNQQLALAALAELGHCEGIAILSAGTDGEDGPTDAAGAFVTEAVHRAARAARLDPLHNLRRNDAYHFFESCGGLFKTGPTQTNVCDLRVVTVDRKEAG